MLDALSNAWHHSIFDISMPIFAQVGSKNAAFYLGKCIKMSTKQAHGRFVHQLSISAAELEKRYKQGEVSSPPLSLVLISVLSEHCHVGFGMSTCKGLEHPFTCKIWYGRRTHYIRTSDEMHLHIGYGHVETYARPQILLGQHHGCTCI